MSSREQVIAADAPAAAASHTRDRAIGTLFLRLSLGLNIAMHGVGRLFVGGLAQFVNSTAAQFQHSVLPMWQVRAFATAIPFFELAIGLLLLAGLGMRWTLSAGALLMICLEFGTAIRSDWTVLTSQLTYSLVYFILFFCRSYDSFSLDALRNRSSR